MKLVFAEGMMMSRTMFISLSSAVFLCLFCFVSAADYLDAPDWSDSNDFTHQSWGFNGTQEMETDGPPLPLIADGDPNWDNDFGTPLLLEADNTHEWMKRWYVHPPALVTDRVCMYGGMDDTYVLFYIPNQQRQGFWQKQLWIQMTYFARKDGVKNYDVFIARDSNFLDVNDTYLTYGQIEEPNEEPGSTGKWYRLTAVYRMDNQPGEEYIELWAYNDPAPAMAASMIDQVDIDTRCVNLDMFEDGYIDLRDYAVFAASYLQQNPKIDLYPDPNSYIDNKDLSVLLEYWLQYDSSQ